MAKSALIPVLVFFMLLTGICNTLLTKYQDMQCVADCQTKRPKTFEQPVLQTLQMFIGESGCWLVVFVSWIISRFRRVDDTTPAQDIVYEAVDTEDREDAGLLSGERAESGDDMTSSQTLVDPTNAIATPKVDIQALAGPRRPLRGRMVTMLALPAICDIIGTTLMNVGLLLVAASIYQMMRGALVLFVGLFSVIFLKRHLGGWKWASLFVVVIGVALVGLAGVLDHQHTHADLPGDTRPGPDRHDLVKALAHHTRATASAVASRTPAETILGVLLIAGAQIFTASQFVLEESIMEKYSMDPIQVVGWEGVFGFAVTLIATGVLHLTVGMTEQGRGGYFDAREGFSQMFHNRAIAVTSLLIMISIGGFNYFGLSVTRVISATSRSTIDTCRTLFIWLFSLGLGWETFKWLQVPGFALLVYGTAVFNEIVRPPTLNFIRSRLGRS